MLAQWYSNHKRKPSQSIFSGPPISLLIPFHPIPRLFLHPDQESCLLGLAGSTSPRARIELAGGQPIDQTFVNFRASRSVDRRFLFGWETLTDSFWGSKLMQYSVGPCRRRRCCHFIAMPVDLASSLVELAAWFLASNHVRGWKSCVRYCENHLYISDAKRMDMLKGHIFLYPQSRISEGLVRIERCGDVVRIRPLFQK